MTEDTMQAAWKDITERLQRMERKEVQHATEMKDAINVRQAVATGHVAGNQALDRKEMPVMKDQIAKLIDVINTPKQRPPLQMQIERGCNIENKDDKLWETFTRNQTMEEERSKKFVIGGPKFEGLSKTAHDWCPKTTSYFLNEWCETRTKEEIKTCLWECLDVKVRCRAMHLERNGLAFCNFLVQEYFERLLYCFVKFGSKLLDESLVLTSYEFLLQPEKFLISRTGMIEAFDDRSQLPITCVPTNGVC